MQAMITNQYERMTVHVPRLEAKRFRAVVKALGFDIEKKNAIDLAMDGTVFMRWNTVLLLL